MSPGARLIRGLLMAFVLVASSLCVACAPSWQEAHAQRPQPGPGLLYVPLTDPAAPWPDDGRETSLTFVHITDTHVGRGSDAEAFAVAIEAIETIRPRPAFVLITGDLTEAFRDAEVLYLKHLLDRFTLPLLLLPGNHDDGFDPTPRSVAKWNREFPAFATPYARDFGPIRIIAMDAQLHNARRANTAVVDEERRQWSAFADLVRQARAEDRRILLAYHIPIVPSFFRQRVKKSWRTADMERMRKLQREEAVEATLTGHLHRDETYLEDKTWLLNAPPISVKYHREPSYRLFRVTPDGLMFRQIYLTKKSAHLSYELDLHGLTPEQIDQGFRRLEGAELERFWTHRYAGDAGTKRLFGELHEEHFLRFLQEPFSYQPVEETTRYFKDDPADQP